MFQAPYRAVAALASDNSSPEWHDTFAILALSVKTAFATSKFDLDLFALTSKAMSNKEDTVLKNIGSTIPGRGEERLLWRD